MPDEINDEDDEDSEAIPVSDVRADNLTRSDDLPVTGGGDPSLVRMALALLLVGGAAIIANPRRRVRRPRR